MKVNFETPLNTLAELELKALGFDLMIAADSAKQRAEAFAAAVEEVRAELAAREASKT